MSGPEISEAEHEVVTHLERPVVAKRCRLGGSTWAPRTSPRTRK
jgi:hypothetical protein